MLPDFRQMGAVMAAIMALIERGVVALESINRHLFTLADIESRHDARERELHDATGVLRDE